METQLNGIYAGIGSRETPHGILNLMIGLGARLANLGFMLHSGGARKRGGVGISADTAFEYGCDKVGGTKRIFLPSKGFHNSTSELYTVCDDAIEMAKYYHPRGNSLSPYILKLMGRNCYQVLGADLQSPVDFICCWTPDGKASGGTGQALRIAVDRGIFIYNLYNKRLALQGIRSKLQAMGVEGLKDGTCSD